METEALPDNETTPLPVPTSPSDRLLYALLVIILPIASFSASSLLKPEWQSGKFTDYINLMFLPQVAWIFFPFLFYAIFCFVLLLIAPQRFAPRFVIRLGIYSGVLLALQYAILVTLSWFAYIGLISAGCMIAFKWTYGKVPPKWRFAYFILWLLSILVVCLIVFKPDSLHSFFQSSPIGILAVILSAGPILCLTIMALVAVKLFKTYDINVRLAGWQATSMLGWLATYVFAWRFSILQAIDVYHSLPIEPPGCYIATASARGHQRFVKSKLLVTPHGKMYVTRQLQNLKCAEIALMALTPQLHKQLRRIYDRFGPPLAARLTHPFLADLAYTMLKPVEWMAMLALKVIVPEIAQYARRFYSQK